MTEYNRPKLLFIMHLPPPVHGASMVGKYIKDSTAVNNAFDCRYINLMTSSSLEDIGKGGLRKVKRFFNILKEIRWEVRDFKPDLVYVTPNAKGGAFYKDFVVVQMLKRLGCKVVAHYHNKGVSTRQDKWLDNLLYKKFFKNLQVILLSERLYPDMEKYVDRKDVHICPNGIPETLTSEPDAKRGNIIPKILFLSNLIPSKGVIVLLDALSELKQKGEAFVCDYVGGETPEMSGADFAEEVRKRDLDDCVHYHGKKYGDEKCEYLAGTDIFVFPSFYSNEAFPLVLLEAMEYKLPVVATDEGGMPDIAINGENGFVCKKRDSHDLAEKIAILLKDSDLRERMGERGYKRFKDQFTLDVFEKDLVEVLNTCIAHSE